MIEDEDLEAIRQIVSEEASWALNKIIIMIVLFYYGIYYFHMYFK